MRCVSSLFLIVLVGFLSRSSGSKVKPAASVKSLKISEKNAGVINRIGSYAKLWRFYRSVVWKPSIPTRFNWQANKVKVEESIIDHGNGCSMNPVCRKRLEICAPLKNWFFLAHRTRVSLGIGPAHALRFHAICL